MIFEITGAIIALVVAVYFIFLIFNKKKLEKVKLETISSLSQYGIIHHEGKKLLFKTAKRDYQVLFCNISGSSELVINSRIKWEILNSGTSRILDQSVFLASTNPKIIIVYPTVQVIKRFINENEMVFIKPTDYFYDMHIIRDVELEDVLKEGIL